MTLQDTLKEVLSDGQWHSGQQLAELVSHRFGDVIHKLRKKGVQIETKQGETDTEFFYRCLDPKPKQQELFSLPPGKELLQKANRYVSLAIAEITPEKLKDKAAYALTILEQVEREL